MKISWIANFQRAHVGFLGDKVILFDTRPQTMAEAEKTQEQAYEKMIKVLGWTV